MAASSPRDAGDGRLAATITPQTGPNPMRRPVSPPPPFNARRKPKVLLVDDHRQVLEMVAALLSQDSDVVGVASSATQALARARQVTPDVIVMDVEMPGLDGFQTIRALRQDALPDIPVVFRDDHGSRTPCGAPLGAGMEGRWIVGTQTLSCDRRGRCVAQGHAEWTHDPDRLAEVAWELDDYRRAECPGATSRLTVLGNMVVPLSADGSGYASSCFHAGVPGLWSDVGAEHRALSHAHDV